MRLSDRSIQYAWREIARRAGLPPADAESTGFEKAGLRVHYGSPDGVAPGSPAVAVVPCDSGGWRRVIDLPAGALETLPLSRALPDGSRLPLQDPLPILFRSAGTRPGGRFASLQGSLLVVEVDLLAASLFLLSRWEETIVEARDAHGRMPFAESVAHKQGFLTRPLLDEYAFVLQEWLRVLMPGWRPQRPSFSINLTHDVDAVGPFGTRSSAVRTLLGDVVRRRDLAKTRRTWSAAKTQLLRPRESDEYRGILHLADLSKKHGFRSAFYFMASEPGRFDSGYRPEEPSVRECFRLLRDVGFEIGFHPGYETLGRPERLASQRDRLAAASGEAPRGGRQHYLRFEIPETWRHWEATGLSYDSTMGFADHEGFRCGTCHAYKPFDLERDREIDVWEVPLIVMDATLRLYRRLTPTEAERAVVDLARRCRAVGGTFTLLWHNSSLAGDWADWAAAYERIVSSLARLRDDSGPDAARAEATPEEHRRARGAYA